MIDLGTLGGTVSSPRAVNDSGQVVGYSNIAGDAEYHAFSWTEAGGMIDLGTLGGTAYSVALDVNNSGQVVGASGNTYWESNHAFSWTEAGGMIDLTLGSTGSYAYAVNDSGWVVGSASWDGGHSHARLWVLRR